MGGLAVINMRITIGRPDFSALSAGELRKIHTAAGKVGMEWFLKTRMPKRFDGSMKDELFWKDRDSRWKKRKESRKLGGVPHKWTGHTEALFRRAVARVTPKFLGIKVQGLGPQYGRFSADWKGSKNGKGIQRKKTSSKPRMREEIARLTDWEVAEIGRIYARVFVELGEKALARRRMVTMIA